MLECGDTFLTGDDEDEGYHLWIVMTPPSEGEVVTVSVTTLRKRSENWSSFSPENIHSSNIHPSLPMHIPEFEPSKL